MAVLFSAVIPVAFIILIGWIAGRMLHFDLQSPSQIIVYVLAPALVADSLYRTQLSVQSAASLLLGVALISLCLYLIVWGVSCALRLPRVTQKMLLVTTLHPNNGNMGLPLIDFAFGAAGLERAIVYMIGTSILLFGVAPALLKGGGWQVGWRMTLKLPLIWAMLGGLALRLLNVKLPFKLDEALHLLGKSAIPLALLILGMQLADTRFGVARYELGSTALKLLVAPVVAFGIGRLLHLQGLDAQVLILQTAMPTAVNTIVLATEFGGDSDRVAKTIVVTTLASFLTLPILLWSSAGL